MKGHLFESLKILEKLNRITIHYYSNNSNIDINTYNNGNGNTRNIENIALKAKFGLTSFNSTAPDVKRIRFKKKNASINTNSNSNSNTNTVQSDGKADRLKKLGFSI